MSEKRSFFSKKDLIIIILLILIPLFIISVKFMFSSSNSLTAVVTVDGKIVEKITLSEYKDDSPTDFSLEKYGVDIVLRAKNSQIAFLSSNCPDHVCVNTGFLKKENDIAVCLPNKTSVVIYKTSDAEKLN